MANPYPPSDANQKAVLDDVNSLITTSGTASNTDMSTLPVIAGMIATAVGVVQSQLDAANAKIAAAKTDAAATVTAAEKVVSDLA